jgi:hypothetical protein
MPADEFTAALMAFKEQLVIVLMKRLAQATPVERIAIEDHEPEFSVTLPVEETDGTADYFVTMDIDLPSREVTLHLRKKN